MHQHRRLLPLDWDEFDYFDIKYMEWYVCEHAKIKYQEKLRVGITGGSEWSEFRTMNLKCYTSWFSKRKIRIHYYFDMQPGV